MGAHRARTGTDRGMTKRAGGIRTAMLDGPFGPDGRMTAAPANCSGPATMVANGPPMLSGTRLIIVGSLAVPPPAGASPCGAAAVRRARNGAEGVMGVASIDVPGGETTAVPLGDSVADRLAGWLAGWPPARPA